MTCSLKPWKAVREKTSMKDSFVCLTNWETPLLEGKYYFTLSYKLCFAAFQFIATNWLIEIVWHFFIWFLKHVQINIFPFFTSSPQSPRCGCQLPEPGFLIRSQQVKRGRLGLPLVCLPTLSFWHRQEVLDECYYVIQYRQPQIQVLNHILIFSLCRVLDSPSNL